MNFVIPTLFLVCHLALIAQEPIRYTTRQGLPSNTVYDVKQDARGFMWFATEHGIVKFDGDTFRNFTLEDGLSNNNVWKLSTTFDGKIWYMSKSEYQGYIYNDSVYSFPVEDHKPITPRRVHNNGNRIWLSKHTDLLYTLEGNMFTKIRGRQNSSCNTLNDAYVYYRIPIFNPDCNCHLKFKEGALQLLNLDGDVTREIHLKDVPKDFFQLRIIDYGVMPFDTFYVINKNGVLFLNVKKPFSKYISFQNTFGTEHVRVGRCNTLPNEIQISVPGHLMILDYNFELLEKHHFPSTIDHENSYKDRDGNIWLTSLNKGITLITAPQLETQYYFRDKNVQQMGMVNDTLITGVTNETYYRYEEDNDTFHNLGIASGYTYNIISGKRNYLVSTIGTLKLTTLKDLADDRFISYSGCKDLIEHKALIYGILHSGVSILRPKDKHTSNYELIISAEGLNSIEDFDNRIYVGGSQGLSYINNNGLIDIGLSVPVNSLTKNDRFLFISTNGKGVYLYDGKTVIPIEATKGLDVQKIIPKDNQLWLATHKGVHRVKLDDEYLQMSKIVNSFYWEDGLLQNTVNDIYIDENFLWASSNIGLSRIDLKNSIYTKPPKLYFKAKEDTLIFKGRQRAHMTIAFNVLDYYNQNNYDFSFSLGSYQSGWTKTTSKTIHLSGLGPDIYQLDLKSTDQHGNETIKTKYISVHPYWWETTWVRVIFALLIIICLFVIYGIIYLWITKRERKKGQLHKQVSELELKALRSQMNPHFVHNCINSIQYYIQRNDTVASENYLSEFAKLIRYFFEHSRQKTVSILAEAELLTSYLEIEKLRFEDKFSYDIIVHSAIDAKYELLPSSILQPIVENAVNHGIFHKQGQGTITVSFKKLEEDTIEVIVEDDGIGLKKSSKIQQNAIGVYASHSSEVIKERIALLNQTKNWEIYYTISDMKQGGTNPGTSVRLTFKNTKYENYSHTH
ncbi:sensor histidine kinase [Winogradskyella sp.]|uniref:sensor histidine kinase n=1 Tax=Winogradskyella sp. TaxID=1883156 RepID=UPI003BAB11D0